MKFNESGTMSDKDKKNQAKAVLSKNQPKDEPDADDLEPSGTIERMSIEPADGGYTIETHHKPKSTKGANGPEYRQPSKRVIGNDHPDAAHIHALIGRGKK